MSSSISDRLLRLLIGCMITVATGSASAQGTVVLSKVFQVCVKGFSGLTADSKQGIDAVEGRFAGNGGAVDFMISSNPNLPAAMNLRPDKTSVISRQLPSDLQFVAESVGPLQMGATGSPIGYGTERLYAFSKGILSTPVGDIQDQIFVQLWSDGHPRNVELLKKVGGSIHRCQ